ncbi:hypothetical protein C2845_PM17G03100 [Panicum miliaceum]|uniref:Bowman-Birk serine protease inhibitors family domain-containing protein n=1 Tax=Panicum miliaceum TaxID=4540 RepID=A0A3L6Q1C8_PANMI|nr:hypothetical protein C2845_PM17G03100 [Panicum miliaceum]
MAIILVAQAVLIMGVVFAAVSIENSAALGEKEITREPAEPEPNPGQLTCCNKCTPVSSPPSGLFKCQDEREFSWCKNSVCKACQPAKTYRNTFSCNDVFNGTCGPRCSKN